MKRLLHEFSIRKSIFLGEYIPFFIITFSVFIDILNGVIQNFIGKDFSIGIIYRGLLYIMLLPFILRKYSFFISLLIWGISLNIWLLLENYFSITYEIIDFTKSTYIYVILTFFIHYRKNLNINFISNCVIGFGLIASISLLFSFLTGIGVSYGDYRFGIKSFFGAGNDIGLALLISLTLSIKHFFENKTLTSLIVPITITIACMLLGTRAGIFGSILIWVVFAIGILLFRFRGTQISASFKILITCFILIALFGTIQFVQKITSISDYMQNKFVIEVITEGSARKKLSEAGKEAIAERQILSDIFGQGNYSFQKHVNYYRFGNFDDIKQVEVDFIDIVGAYGIFGLILIIIPLYIYYLSIRNTIKKLSIHNLSSLIAMTIYLGHSFFAGHALCSPTVASVMAVVYYLIIIDSKKNTLIL